MKLSFIIVVIVAVLMAAIPWWVRRRKISSIPNMTDEEFSKFLPTLIDRNVWIETRKMIAKIWGISHVKLDPRMSIEVFGKRVSVVGDSELESDTISEDLLDAGISYEEFESVKTLGELFMLYSKVVDKTF